MSNTASHMSKAGLNVVAIGASVMLESEYR